jgi:transposase
MHQNTINNEEDSSFNTEERTEEVQPDVVRRRRTIGVLNISVDNTERERIIEKSLEGFSARDISSFFGKNYQTVNSIIKKYFKTGNINKENRGGDRRSKLSTEIKEQLIAHVDLECTLTLDDLTTWVLNRFGIVVSKSTIDRSLKDFHYTLKRVTVVPERRNCEATIAERVVYAANFRVLEADNDDKNFVFLDEVGFCVVSRPSRGRSRIGQSSYVVVSASRSRNISVIAAMNKYGMIYHKINERSVNGEDFKVFLKEIKIKCVEAEILNPIFIMDNARIHHYRGLFEDPEIAQYNIRYLPPYSPFLNPIENVFSVCKNNVIRGGAMNESQLRTLIAVNFEAITNENCSSFYRKMLGYLARCSNMEVILE